MLLKGFRDNFQFQISFIILPLPLILCWYANNGTTIYFLNNFYNFQKHANKFSATPLKVRCPSTPYYLTVGMTCSLRHEIQRGVRAQRSEKARLRNEMATVATSVCNVWHWPQVNSITTMRFTTLGCSRCSQNCFTAAILIY